MKITLPNILIIVLVGFVGYLCFQLYFRPSIPIENILQKRMDSLEVVLKYQSEKILGFETEILDINKNLYNREKNRKKDHEKDKHEENKLDKMSFVASSKYADSVLRAEGLRK